MKLVAGIDLHSNNAVCGIMDMKGKRMGAKKLPGRLEPILGYLAPFKSRLETVAVESTYNWYWLVDGLQDHGYTTVLANPAKMDQYSGLKHTDDTSDAYFLTELLRLEILPTGWLCERKLRPIRDMLRRRLLLVHHRTSLLLSHKSLHARTTGLNLPLRQLKALKVSDLSELLPHPADQLVAVQELELTEHLGRAIALIEAAVLAGVDKLPAYRQLQGLPGVGKILGLTITLETGQIERFAGAGNFASYARCVDSRRLSNNKRKGSNNRKCGNKHLAWAFVEAAHFAARSYPECGRFYERKKAKTNPIIATKALACKLAKAAWHVMKEDRPFEMSKAFPGKERQK